MRARLKKFLAAGLLGAAAGVAAAMAPRRPSPAEREQRRRLKVFEKGRTGNAMILDVDGCVLTYQYDVRGVKYTASQDVSGMADRLPPEPALLIGRPALIKYLSRNPANSIVVCEEWSGLRFQPLNTTREPIAEG